MTNDETMPNARMTNGRPGASRFRYLSPACFGSFVVFVAAALSLRAEPPPSAQQILAMVRLQQSHQQIELNGQLREKDLVIPFQFNQDGPLIRYTFKNPDEVLQLRLEENGSRLEIASDTGTEKIPAAKLQERIRETGVTYGDLALKFLYWSGGKVLGDETVHARSCWKVQLSAPSRDSPYSNVLLWSDKDSGALMRIEGYDWNGKIAKRFEVVSAQKIEQRWFLKQMRVEEFQPGTNKVQARTYLEIKKPKGD